MRIKHRSRRWVGGAAGVAVLGIFACDAAMVDPEANTPPVAEGTIEIPVLQDGASQVMALAEYFGDPDGDELVYAAASSDAEVATATISRGELELRGVGVGTATVTITASDAGGITVTRFIVTVVDDTQRNRGPTSRGSIPTQRLAGGVNGSVSMRAYFHDPDGDAMRYIATSSNPGAVVAFAAGDRLVVEPVAGGAATVTVTAQDPHGGEARQSFQAVALNQPPITTGMRLQDQCTANTATGVRIFDLSNHFTDPDGGTLTYSATSSDTRVAGVSVSGTTLTVTPGNSWVETIPADPNASPPRPVRHVRHSLATVTVSASDGTATVSRSFKVFVLRQDRGGDNFRDFCMAPGAPLDRQDPGGLRPGQVEFNASDALGAHQDGDRYYLNYENTHAAGFAISETGTVRLRGRTPGNEAEMTVTRCRGRGGDTSCRAKKFMVATLRDIQAVSSAIPPQFLDGPGSSTTVNLESYFTPGDEADRYPFTYTAVSSNTANATVSISGSTLTVTASAGAFGRATVTVTADDTRTETVVKFKVTVYSQDRAALTDLYNAAAGGSWFYNRNWDSPDKLISEWFGVVTNSAGRVRRLDLYHNNIVGTVPSSLGGLTAARYVRLNNNYQLRGTIADALVQALKRTYTVRSEVWNGVLWITHTGGLCTLASSDAASLRNRGPFYERNFLGGTC